MANNTQYKSVVVKEDAKTSLAEAGIYDVRIPDGGRVAVLAHMFFPNHDRSLVRTVLRYLRDSKPELVILQGGIVDESAFKSLWEEEDNYLHEYPDAPEVSAAREKEGFEPKVLSLGSACGDFVKEFAEACGGTVIYIPSATHLSMPNEVRLMEAIQRKKKVLDAWSDKHPDAPEKPSDPMIDLPKKLSKLFGIDGLPNIHVLRYGAAVKLNGKTLFMIGDFRRRNAGDASKVEWEQRGLDIVRSFDGKVASSWMTTPDHTLPGLKLKFWQFHEVGFLWDPTRMGHLRDYDRRAPGFFTGVIVNGELFGSSVVVLRGDDGRRSFVVDGVPYTEDSPGALPNGHEISLAPGAGTAKAKPASKPARKPAAKKTTRKRGSSRGKRS